MPERKIRVMVAKPGLDGHDRGAQIVEHLALGDLEFNDPAWDWSPDYHRLADAVRVAA